MLDYVHMAVNFLIVVVAYFGLVALVVLAILRFKRRLRPLDVGRNVHLWNMDLYLELINDGHEAHCAHNMVYGLGCQCPRGQNV